MTHPIRAKALFLCLFFIPLSTAPAMAQDTDEAACKKDPAFYEAQGYRVRSVRIDTPLGWLFSSVARVTKNIISADDMPIKSGHTFQKHTYDAGHLFVEKHLPELNVARGGRIAARFSAPSLANCDPNSTPKKLDVVYRVYDISFSGNLSRTFELGKKEEVSRGVAGTKATRRLAKYFVQPYAGYNGSREVFGGTKFTMAVASGPVDKLSVEAAGSPSSSQVRAAGGGTFDREAGLIRYAEWITEYEYTDSPGDDFRLRGGTGRAQIIAATKPVGAAEFVLRFGGAVEGGNRQLVEEGLATAGADAPDTGHKALKAFVGGNLRVGRHAFKASYGAQFGNAGDGFKLDYIKHVFDSAASFRFVPWDPHRPVTLDAQFTSGAIQQRGTIPGAERFFGGNAGRSFIAGESWDFRGDPFIRSFSENSFGRTSAGGLGGDRFFSVNLTLGITAWHYPLVPSEILDDCTTPDKRAQAEAEEDDGDTPGTGTPTPDTTPEGGVPAESGDPTPTPAPAPTPDTSDCVTVEESALFQLSAAKSIIKSTYLAETPEVKDMSARAANMVRPFNDLKVALCPYASDPKFRQAFCPQATPVDDPNIRPVMEEIHAPPVDEESETSGSLVEVDDLIKKIREDAAEEKADTGDFQALAVGWPEAKSEVENLSDDLKALTPLLPAAVAARVDGLRGEIEAEATAIVPVYRRLEASQAAEEADKKAKRDMVYPTRVVLELLREANIVSVSPVLMLDAARLWRRGQPPGDVRYAAGGGLRTTLVSLEVTAGYAWNLRRRPGEGRGAFIFSIDISNLFR